VSYADRYSSDDVGRRRTTIDDTWAANKARQILRERWPTVRRRVLVHAIPFDTAFCYAQVDGDDLDPIRIVFEPEWLNMPIADVAEDLRRILYARMVGGL
jgi:hypothetical protein